MRLYCPNCGQANETGPSARVMCTACTAVFDAPPDLVPPEQELRTLPRQPTAAPEPSPSWPPSAPSYGTPATLGTVQVTNPLAIISLVAGLGCCLPLVSPLAAIITGAIALSQINANPERMKGKGLAIAGITIGSLSLLLSILGFFTQLARLASE